ncbi:hypothetical protein, partial [Stenotrophomonas indicatrix]|uniref:hypothetical protein n=1 Tax=Stenotrophomonas indicatrix TaxID=2045451 RepID=UPI002FDE7478
MSTLVDTERAQQATRFCFSFFFPWLDARKELSKAGYEGFWQGLQPCTRYKPEQQQQQQQQRHSVGWRGTVGLRGRRKYVLVGLV